MSNNKILITGGGTGIGLELTEKFMSEDNTVIICGRRESALNEVAEKFPSVVTKVCDLEVEQDRIELYDWIVENHADLNVLVNNAGIQNWMNVSEDDFFEKTKAEVAINILAPLHLTKLFLNLSSLNAVINVTSGLAFTTFSRVPVYCGTKAFMRSFSISLRHQLKDKNVEVIELIPPALNTGLGGQGVHDGLPSVSDFIASIFEQLQQGKTELTFSSSEGRAKANNEAIENYMKQLNPLVGKNKI